MKKGIVNIISLGLVVGLIFGSTNNVEAATVKKFKNCTEMNKVYKGGVAKSKSVKNKGGKTKYKPLVSSALYKANSSKDRDKDGIACER